MGSQPITTSTLTPTQRRQILGAITGAVRRTFRYPMPPTLPRYPDAIADIDGHIDWLVQAVRDSKPGSRAAAVVKHSCPACPHQYPSRYCPLRPRGGCVLYRCADAISEAVAAVLDDLEGEQAVPLAKDRTSGKAFASG